MRVTILGCGGSNGVPSIGFGWGACDPDNPKNRRRRVSILVEDGPAAVLVDTAPELREQLLDAGCERLDGVIYTHEHADHTHGLNDLRMVAAAMRGRVPVWGDARTLDSVMTRFSYAFKQPQGSPYRAFIEAYTIDGRFEIAGMAIRPFEQDHGFGARSLGLRFGPIAYSTDAIALPESAFEILDGIDTWIVDCVQYDRHPTHAHFDQVLEWRARVRPRRTILTHMSGRLDYEDLLARCPEGVEPAYDGMVVAV